MNSVAEGCVDLHVFEDLGKVNRVKGVVFLKRMVCRSFVLEMLLMQFRKFV